MNGKQISTTMFDLNDVTFTFARSSGPGGQNVNKVETKARLQFDIFDSKKLTSEQKFTLSQDRDVIRYLDRASGQIIITSQKFRSQLRNKEDALLILNQLIANALKPKIIRKKTKKPKSADRKRLEDKRFKSDRKKSRSHKDY